MNYQNDLPAADGVGSGQKAVFTLPIGPLYKEAEFSVSDTAGDSIDNIVDLIEIILNGKTQRQHTPRELNHINSLEGSAFALVNAGTNTTPGNAGYVAMITTFFQEPWWKETYHQELFAWGTGNLSSFQVKFHLAAKAGIALSGQASVAQSLVNVNNQQVQRPLGKIIKVYRNELVITGSTQKLKTPFKIPNVDRIHAIHIDDTDVSKIIIRNGRTIIYEKTKQQADSLLLKHDMVPDANWFDVSFDYDNLPENSLAMDVVDNIPVTDLTIEVQTSDPTPRNIPVLYQVYGQPD